MDPQTFFKTFGLNPDEQQKPAIERTDGTVLLLAVPGSGKTTTLITRLGYLVFVRGIDPRAILAITYTVAAAQHMKEAYCAVFGEDTGQRISFRTINALCWEIVARYYRERNREIGVCDETRQKTLIRAALKEINRETFPLETDIISVQTGISLVKNMCLQEEEIQNRNWDVEHFPQIFRHYTNALIQNRLADYDDQMVFALKILQKNADIRMAWHSRFPYVSVDETQDTSLLQHRILQTLFAPDGNLFFVGDEDQSIYGYRGACPELMHNLNDCYPDVQVMKLETNYRSLEEIVSSAKDFIDGSVRRQPKDMRAFRGSGGRVQFIDVNTRKGQLAAVLSMCSDPAHRPAILFRNNESAVALIDLLERNHIPFLLNKTRDTFFSGRTVSEVRTFFQFALDLNNPALFMKCYSRFSLYFRRDRAEQAAARFSRSGRSLLDEFVEQNRYLKGAPKFQIDQTVENAEKFRSVFRQVSRKRPLDALHQLEGLGYETYLEDRDAGQGQLEILEMIAEETETAEQFLIRLETLKNLLGEGTADPNAVFLSTIHSAKGMEFDHVILFDVINGILPAAGSGEDPGQYQEERRLFYVGMTRARNLLSVFCVRSKKHSFVKEIRAKKKKRKKPEPPQTPKQMRKIRTLTKILSFYGKGTELHVEDVRTKLKFLVQIVGRAEDTAMIAVWQENAETGELTLCTEEAAARKDEKRWRLTELPGSHYVPD